MSSLPLAHVTPEEYLKLDRAASGKHEYRDGEAYRMPDVMPVDSLVASNVQCEIATQVRGEGCFVFSSTLRVSVRWETLITYPDVTVVCGPLEYACRDPWRETITNPTLVAEVLSKQTARIDRGEKAFLYRQMPSLREILLVEPSRVWVEHSWRLDNGHWEIETLTGLAAMIHLSGLGCDLAVSEIYRKAEIYLDAK